MDKKLTVRINPALLKRLKITALRRGLTLQALVIATLEEVK